MATFSDNFDRADNSDLGPNWVEVSGDWSISSGRLSPGAAGGTIILRAAASMDTSDNFAQATIAATGSVSQGVWCRGNANITSGYLWRNNGSEWDLFSVVGGSFTVLGTYVAPAAVNDIAKVQAVGSTIKCFVNGVERVSVTNTDIPTGTNVGIRCESSASVLWDNFVSGDVSAGATLPTASSSETSQPITGEKSSSLGFSSENDDTQAVGGNKTGGFPISSSGDSSMPLSGEKSVTLSVTSESDTAGDISGNRSGTLSVSEENASSQAVTGGKTATLSPALESSTANSIRKEGSSVSQSILNTTKKLLSQNPDDPSFDEDVLVHINSVFADLAMLGLGPDEGFEIVDDTATWDEFIYGPKQNQVKSYMYLRLRLIFDPPTNPTVLNSMERQVEKYEWLLNVEREGREWQNPAMEIV